MEIVHVFRENKKIKKILDLDHAWESKVENRKVGSQKLEGYSNTVTNEYNPLSHVMLFCAQVSCMNIRRLIDFHVNLVSDPRRCTWSLVLTRKITQIFKIQVADFCNNLT